MPNGIIQPLYESTPERLIREVPKGDSYSVTPIRRETDWVKHHAAIRAILGSYRGSEYKVYALLDSWCDENNQTWIGIERISSGTLLKERQVQNLLATLEHDGWITREPRFNEYQMQVGVTYTLPHRMPQKAYDSGGAMVNAKSDAKSDAKTYAKGDAITSATDCTQVNPSNDQVNPSTPPTPPPDDYTERLRWGFAQFESAYPKKTDNEAKQEWAKINPDPDMVQAIVAAIGTWKKSVDWNNEHGKYIHRPSNWLKERKWEVTPEPNDPYEGMDPLQRMLAGVVQ